MSNTAAEFSVTNLRNGTYTTNVAVEGGNGTDMICTPMNVFIDDGEATAVVVWSTTACEYMEVAGVRVDPMSRDDGSIFYLPVDTWDEEVEVIAGLNPEGVKEEVEYVMTFDSASMERQTGSIIPLAIMGTLVVVLAIANAYVMVKHKHPYVESVEKKKPKKYRDK